MAVVGGGGGAGADCAAAGALEKGSGTAGVYCHGNDSVISHAQHFQDEHKGVSVSVSAF